MGVLHGCVHIGGIAFDRYRSLFQRKRWMRTCLLRGRSLKLSGPALADIYSAKIRQWDDGPIAELNPGVHLPHHAIVPVRRADSSGDTFIFT
jgi:hypothetical protein